MQALKNSLALLSILFIISAFIYFTIAFVFFFFLNLLLYFPPFQMSS